MPQKIKDLAVKTGSYVNRDGDTKGRYENVGSILQMDDGSKIILLKRCFNPSGVPFKEGSDQIIISMFDPKERDGGAPGPQVAPAPRAAPVAAAGAAGGFDDDLDIPF